nr:farnesyl-diphosphate farnesyltransferase [Cryptococcus depauperatus CBS 7841]
MGKCLHSLTDLVTETLTAVTHPAELRAMVNFAIWRDTRDITDPKELSTTCYNRPTMKKCWDFLDLTSRSFARVIRELEGDLARTVCIFYLVLRALDTVEDDMTIPNDIKLPLLRAMHTKLYEPEWTFNGSKEKDKIVLEEFDVIQTEFTLLNPKYQAVIADICKKMGAGMADFAALATPERPVAEVNSIADYDLYCHYVAGLVGEGLSGLFAASGKERSFIADKLTLSNSMGLLLQKTNIYRDLHEDVVDGRGFWPRAIWGKYGFESMKELIDPEREKEAMWAASEMVLDALRHTTDALDYLTLLRCQSVFNFVAIPAVMAIATLERTFMNPKILRENVKIRKGETIRLIVRATNPRDVSYIFRDYARKIHAKVLKDDPNLLKISIACAQIEQWTEHHYPTFIQISGGGATGAVQTAIDATTKDARATLFTHLAKEAQEASRKARQEKLMAELRTKGLIKSQEPTDEDEEAKKRYDAIKDQQGTPWMMVISVIVGVLALMAALGGGIVWVVITYFDDQSIAGMRSVAFRRELKGRILSRIKIISEEFLHAQARLYSTPNKSSKPPRFGQPHASTHPHLVHPGDLTPGVPAKEYEHRRRQLMEELGDGAKVICMGGTVRLMSQSIFYRFRQATDFYYLTGFHEPDATVILESAPSTSRGYKYTLFVPPKNPHDSLWEGERAGIDGAVNNFGADEAHPNTCLSSFLSSFMSSGNLFASLPPSPSPSPSSQPFNPVPSRRRSPLMKLFSPALNSPSDFLPSDPPHLLLAAALSSERAMPLEKHLQRLRMIKTSVELALMKRAAEISSAAHTKVMRAAKIGGKEADLEAIFGFECAMEGSERQAYVPVVASGANALVIHYTKNDCVLNQDEMVLIDAGCEYHMYTSDITRTFPVSGKFTPPQHDLYQAVLNAQKECIKRCLVQDNTSLSELHRISCRLLLEELKQIGFRLSIGDVERTLYPHFLSHHLGSDLHDCPTRDRNAALVEGNVISIEPGVYVPHDTRFPKAFHGLGIRIEDEVAFQGEGPLVLSANAPKEIVDVEGACQGLLD